jgi:hypothetical protein
MKFLIFSLFFYNSLFSQLKTDSIKPLKNHIGIYLSPKVNFDYYSSREITFGSGLMFSRDISKKLALETGLFFSSTKEYHYGLTFSSITEPGSTVHSYDYAFIYKFIEFPLRLKYQILETKKLDLDFFSGFILKNNHKIKSKSTTIYNNGDTLVGNWKNNQFKFYLNKFSIPFGFFLDYKFSKKISFFIQPEIRLNFQHSVLNGFNGLNFDLLGSSGLQYNF